jgi:uridine kinase
VVSRSKVLRTVARRLSDIATTHPLRVAIDGIDAAGKTTFSAELADELRLLNRPIIRASIDNFHHPRYLRYQRGSDSPEGYYEDTFDYESVVNALLKPLGDGGNCCYKTAVFDYRTDLPVKRPYKVADPNAILLVDGVFLMRPELMVYWEYTIWIDVSFETAMNRALQRDIELFGDAETLQQRYETRYFAGQRLYFDACNPKKHANLIIENNDLADPVLIDIS